MSTVAEIKMPGEKVVNQIDKEHAFDAKYPEEQAKAEASELKKDFTKASKANPPQIKMYEIEESDLEAGTALAYTNGYKKKEIPMLKTTGWNGKMEMSNEKVSGIKVDYEVINKEKRRYTSGYHDLASEDEFLKLPSVNKMNLAGFREPYFIRPAPEELWGNIPYADSNAVAGYDRKTSFQGLPYFGKDPQINM